MRKKTPRCVTCGSTNLFYPGFISFVWRRGRWRAEKSSTAEMADGAPIHCDDCGARMVADDQHNDPASGLTLDTSR